MKVSRWFILTTLIVPFFACGSDDDNDNGKAGAAGAQTGGTGGGAGADVGGAAGAEVGGAAGAEVGGAAGNAGTQGSCEASEVAPTAECAECVEEKCNPQCVAFFDIPNAKDFLECFFKCLDTEKEQTCVEGCNEEFKDVVDVFSGLEACVEANCEEICNTDEEE